MKLYNCLTYSTKKRNHYKTIVSRSVFGNIEYQKLKNTTQTKKPGWKTIFTTLLNEIEVDFTQSIKLDLVRIT